MRHPNPLPESPRNHLLRLLCRADLTSAARLAIWLSKRLNKSGLQAEWDALRRRYVATDPVQRVNGPAMQNYFIVLMVQHRFYAEEYKRENRRLAEEADEQNEGTGYLPLTYAFAKDERQRARIKVEIEKCRAEFHRRKAHERQAQAETLRQGARSRSPHWVPTCNWGAPMVVFNDVEPLGNKGDPLGYAQATGQHRKKILAFLKDVKAEPVGVVAQSGRGRPIHLYGTDTNLLVLDQWLGKWLHDSPSYVAFTIMVTIFWNAGEEMDAGVSRKLRRVLLRHWRHVKCRFEAPETLAATVEGIEELLADDQLWSDFCQGQRSERAHRRRS